MCALLIADVQNDCEGGSLAVAGGAAVARAITAHLGCEDGSQSEWVRRLDVQGPRSASSFDPTLADFADADPRL